MEVLVTTGIILAGQGFCLFMNWRIHRVAKYKAELLHKVSVAASFDIQYGIKGWELRYDKLKEVEFGEMVYKFWRTMPSFYPDQRFTDADYGPEEFMGELDERAR